MNKLFDRFDERFSNVTLKDIGHLMHEYVAAGGEIDEVVELRAEWRDRERIPS